MVNNEGFIKRLEHLLDYYDMSASLFADKLGVQRSGLSHLLSGRNKPSLDFVLKIIDNFPEVDLYWLLNGKGSFPKNSEEEKKQTATPTLQKHEEAGNESRDLFSVNEEKSNAGENTADINQQVYSTSNIEKIVIFYKDGTFKDYKPQ